MAKKESVLIALLLSLSAGAASSASPDDRVWITRPDGSLQCDAKSASSGSDPVTEAKTELVKNGVHVLDAKKGNDGKIRAQMCGISTGNVTRFLIPKSELTKAQSIGFNAVP